MCGQAYYPVRTNEKDITRHSVRLSSPHPGSCSSSRVISLLKGCLHAMIIYAKTCDVRTCDGKVNKFIMNHCLSMQLTILIQIYTIMIHQEKNHYIIFLFSFIGIMIVAWFTWCHYYCLIESANHWLGSRI